MQSRTRRIRSINHPLQFVVATSMISLASVGVPAWGQGGDILNEDLKIAPNDSSSYDGFGCSIDIDNGIIAIGAKLDHANGDEAGSAYLFDLVTCKQILKIFPADPERYDRFGTAVALGNGILAVGASDDDDNDTDSGSVYLFDIATGTQINKLTPDDGRYAARFGSSLAIANGIIAIGAPYDTINEVSSGSVYLFDLITGEQITKLMPYNRAAGDRFGHCVDIDDRFVAIGDPFKDIGNPDTGAAYLFDVATGTQLGKLYQSDGIRNDSFGRSIALDNDLVAVGANRTRDDGADSGSMYLFDANTRVKLAKIFPDDGKENANFGSAIDIENGIVVVGANGDSANGWDSGSAYIFNANTHQQIAKLLPSNGTQDDLFGSALAYVDGRIIVGAPEDNHNGPYAGAAYMFDVKTTVSCLALTIEDLIGGGNALFTITNGTPGARCVTVYGTTPGKTPVNEYAGYCATFGIKGINQNRVIGGLNRTFDADGAIVFSQPIPGKVAGMNVLFQAAQRNTCPDECISNLVEMTVQ